MPRRTPTKFRPLAAADEAPQPRRVDHALDLDAAAAVAQALRAQLSSAQRGQLRTAVAEMPEAVARYKGLHDVRGRIARLLE